MARLGIPLSSNVALVRIWSACGSHIRGIVALSVLLNILYIAPTIFMIQVYDRAISSGSVGTLAGLCIIVLIAILGIVYFEESRSAVARLATERIEVLFNIASIRAALTGHPGHQSAPTASLDAIKSFVGGAALAAIVDLPWVSLYLALCFLIHPSIGALAVLSAGILLVFTLWTTRATKADLAEVGISNVRFQSAIGQGNRASQTARALGMGDALLSEIVNLRASVNAAQRRAMRTAQPFGATAKLLRQLLQSGALALGAYLAIREQISVGAVFASTLLVGRALAPVDQLLASWRVLVDARNALGPLAEAVGNAEATRPKTHLGAPRGTLQIENVVVNGPRSDDPILKGISFEIEKGDCVGIVGASGAGKTTLVRLLANCAHPDRGAIRYDGASLDEWDSEVLGKYVGYVPQSPTLFQGSVKDNIARFQSRLELSSELIDRAVVRAAQSSGSHDFIVRLPLGYDTQLGRDGSGLSSGQAQKIALARALYGSPAILILDEPNAHLDAASEAYLTQLLRILKARGTTIIVVAQRPAILVAADKLLTLQGGAVASYRMVRVQEETTHLEAPEQIIVFGEQP